MFPNVEVKIVVKIVDRVKRRKTVYMGDLTEDYRKVYFNQSTNVRFPHRS